MRGKWWQEAVIYQIYPRSFYDSNGDGIGDIKGIIEKLDYLKELGINAIWICPFYDSPMDDNGYDVRNFFDVAEEYGTMDDVKQLVEELKKREMRLIVDLILNHTSDEHPWFVESRQSVDSPYRDYYIWAEPRPDGRPPSNWESFFGGSVWEYDASTNAYYMHIFSKKMPDLNWRNEAMRNDMYQMMEWWLDLGVDGFRIDAVAHLSKNWDFPDGPLPAGRDYSPCYEEYSNREDVHFYIEEMVDRVFSKADIVTIGEAGGASLEDTLKYSGFDRKAFNLLIQFDHCWLDNDGDSAPYVPDKWTFKPLDLRDLKRSLSKYQIELYNKAWPTIYWSNHDQPRILSHYGNDDPAYREVSAKMLATILYFMGGTPIVYQGEEIGMTNVAYDSIDDYRDIEIYTLYRETVEKGIASHDDIMNRIHKRSRDNARTPMQWDDTNYAGFSTSNPWIKVNPNYPMVNVKDQLNDPNSILNYYRRLIHYRQSSQTLIYGAYTLYLEEDEQVYLYTRTMNEDTYLILCNFFKDPVEVTIPSEINWTSEEHIIGNYDQQHLNREFLLRPYEAMVYKLI